MKMSFPRTWLHGLVGFLLATQAMAQGNCIPLWQGFEQQWGYNHRIQRLGDWVENTSGQQGCSIALGHAAASGSGADSASFTQHYVLLRNSVLQSQEGKVTLALTGREGETIIASETVRISLSALKDPGAQYAVLMNGFDLRTADAAKADKLQFLDMGIDSVWQDLPTDELVFRIQVELRFACSTPECEPLNQVVDYKLDFHWLALAGQGMRQASFEFGSGRSWGKQDTIPIRSMEGAMLGDPRFPTALAGIQGLRMHLDHEHHMLAWSSLITEPTYADGLLQFQLKVGFAQNAPGMPEAYKRFFLGRPRLPAGWVLKSDPGSCAWEMRLALLQMEGGQVQPAHYTGGIHWLTRHKRQQSSEAKTAVSIQEIAIPDGK